MVPARLLTAVAALALTAAACSAVSPAGDSDVAATAVGTVSTVGDGDIAVTTLVDADDPANEVSPEALALILADAAANAVTDDDKSPMGAGPSSTATPTSPTSGAPRPPATPAPATGSNPTAGYRGLLGTLGPDDLVGPAAPAPAPVAAANAAPLTGMWLAIVPAREAVVVKIDNSSKARPQVGLNLADIVIEEEVEGGITRLAAIYHSNSTTVGPVRSGRTTDISFLTSLGSPSFVYSGANDVFDALLLQQPTVANYSAARNGGYWRDKTRKAPSNLFADTATFERAGSPPHPQFAYRPMGEQPTWPGASSISVDFGRTVSSWTILAGSDQWQRTQDGKAHMTNGQRVGASNVVLVYTDELDTGLTDVSGSPVPEFVFVGTGRAVVFSGGHVIEGTWTRPSLRSPAILTDATGSVIELNPGRTWIELVGENVASWS
ncbi:MAG: DUF3048 domain-containing protein [Acidimicrobiales bacterium]